MSDPQQQFTSVVYTVTPDACVQDAAALMRTYGVGCVVVVEELVPVGMVTDRDIILRVTAAGLDSQEVPVQKIMTSPLITMAEDQDLSSAVALMRAHGIRRLPIVDQNGNLRSIVTMDDLLFLGVSQYQLRDIVRIQLRRPVAPPESESWADDGRRFGEGRGHPLGTIAGFTKGTVAPPVGLKTHRHVLTKWRFHLARNRSWVVAVAAMSIAAALVALIVAYLLTPPT